MQKRSLSHAYQLTA